MPRKLPKSVPPSRRGDRATSEVCRYVQDPEQDRLSAYHEAGHAVAALLLTKNLVSVDIRRKSMGDGYSLGYTKAPTMVQPKDADAARPLLIQIFAGPFGEGLINPDVANQGADSNDRRQAFTTAALAICPGKKVSSKRFEISTEEQEAHRDEILALLNECIAAASDFVTLHSRAIAAVAAALLQRRFLTAADVAAIVTANPARVVA